MMVLASSLCVPPSPNHKLSRLVITFLQRSKRVKYLPCPEDTLPTLYLRSELQNIQDDIPARILHLVSPVHSLQCDLIPRPCTWEHTSMSPRVNPSMIHHLGSQVQSPQGDPSSQTLSLVSHVHTHQCDFPPRPCTWGHTSSLKGDSSHTACTWSHT